MSDCCSNCGFCYSMIKFDYSGHGCEHTKMQGYICSAFVVESHEMIWMYGINPDRGMCECFTPRKQKDE